MKFICNIDKLKEALGYTERIITRHLTLPILNNFLLKTDKTGLKIISTNLEIGITTWFPCKIIESGEITVPAKIFSNIISNLNTDKISLELRKNNSLFISTDNYKAELKGENAKDFPIIPRLKSDLFFEVDSNIFCQALSQVVGLVSNSETRPEITGIFVSKDKGSGSLKIVGTDSFRLGEKIINLITENNDDGFSLIIPAKTALEVIRIFNNKEDRLKITLEKNQINFELNKTELVSRLIEGNFPDYKKLIPDNFNTKVSLNRDELLRNLKLVSLFSSRINDIMLSFSHKTEGQEAHVKIFASDPDLGENTSDVPINMSGDDIQIKFNWKYLVDGISIIEAKELNLNFIDDIKPCLIRSNQDKNFLYLVMPIRA